MYSTRAIQAAHTNTTVYCSYYYYRHSHLRPLGINSSLAVMYLYIVGGCHEKGYYNALLPFICSIIKMQQQQQQLHRE